MRESYLERKLVEAVEDIGGLCWKFTSPGLRGVPDRVCVFPGGLTAYVEMKAPGGKPSASQLKRHKELRDRGSIVYVIDTVVGVDEFIEAMRVAIRWAEVCE